MSNKLSAKFDPDTLNVELAALSPLHRVAFAASCCERLLPNYYAFSKTEQWGDYEVLRSALDEIWKSIEINLFSVENIQSFIADCDAVIPDTEDFDSPLTSAALDAGTAILETLKCCLDTDPMRAVTVASFARDTVDMYIQDRDNLDYSDPQFEEKISNDPLMLKELKKQSKDLENLKKSPTLDHALIMKLRTDSKSNINVAEISKDD